MHYIATLDHRHDNRWGREENQEKAQEFVPDLNQRAAEHEVEPRGL